MNPKTLSDDDLWTRTRTLATEERRVTLEVLRHLREVEARGLHYDRGYPSLYEYVVRELRYSEGSAYRRIQAMRLLREIPEVESKIEQGSISLTTVTKIQSHCREAPMEIKRSLLFAMEGKSSREVDQAIAESSTVKSFRETTRWIAPNTIELKLFLEKPTFSSLDKLRAVKSHTKDAQSYSGLVTRLVELGEERWIVAQRTASSTRGSTASGNVEYADPRYINPALRREVQQRDQQRCSFVDPLSGKACASTHWLQIDHIQPIALGGKTELANLRLLCGAHNKHRARKTFGTS